MIFDTLSAIADYRNNQKFDNSATRDQCNEIVFEFSGAKHETLVVGNKTILNDEIEKLTCWAYGIQFRMPRSQLEHCVSNDSSSSSSSSSSGSFSSTSCSSSSSEGAPESFQVEITITEIGQPVRIYYGDAVNLNIDWGDTTSDVVNYGTYGMSYKAHAYTNIGVYTLSISGQTSGLEVYDGWSAGVVTNILTPIKGITGLTNLTDFMYGNYNLTSLPEDLFRYCPNVTDFSSCFNYCEGLLTVPEDLFKYNTLATTFYNCFSRNYNLMAIPDNLFAYNTLATNFYLTFLSCGVVTAIPETLFANNTLATSFRATFQGCYGLTSIPTNLFANNSAVTTFQDCFRDCTNLTGNSLPLWNRIPVPIGTTCYRSDVSLTDYASIPAGWK